MRLHTRRVHVAEVVQFARGAASLWEQASARVTCCNDRRNILCVLCSTDKNTSETSITMEAQIQVEMSDSGVLIAAVASAVTIALVLAALAAILCCRFCRPKLIVLSGHGCTKDAISVMTKPRSVVPMDFEVDVDRLPSNAVYCQKTPDPIDFKLQVMFAQFIE